jgi:hypothetical protein
MLRLIINSRGVKMNVFEIAAIAVRILGNFIPNPKPPPVDYSALRNIYTEQYDKRINLFDNLGASSTNIIESPAPVALLEDPRQEPYVETPEVIPAKLTGTGAPVATSCIACSRSHMATIAGALEEAIRFARDGGVTDPEAIRRIDTAEKEINIMERIDLSPEAIQNSPEKDQTLARHFLPKIRSLRQNIGQITSVEKLEKAASEASVLTHEFRLKQMEANGTNLNPILELAKKVQAGEMSMEEARAKVKEYLPKEQ